MALLFKAAQIIDSSASGDMFYSVMGNGLFLSGGQFFLDLAGFILAVGTLQSLV